MDDRSLKFLEFYHLLDILKEYSISPLGRKRCEALRPSKNLSLIQSRLTDVMELKNVLETEGDIPLTGVKDTEGILDKLEIDGSVLDVGELLDLYYQIVLCKGLRRFFQKLEPVKALHLQEKISKLSYQKALEKEILRAINTKGEILDRASPALLDLRHRLGGQRKSEGSARIPPPSRNASAHLPGTIHHSEKRALCSSHQIRFQKSVRGDYP